MAVPVLLDCDPGHDNAMAILLAAASQAIDLHGVTRRQPNARVAVGLDAGRFWELVVATVAALG
jgi:inosine-uridine nucleoside N-ribohydrolase